ncbi:PREDICTED: exosome complex component CSL4-like [Amphimedon queenslandica]|uniref:Exosome complex component CSL4 C-terminal domain-containing protein n=1 Tax=Amphimedon queenslandica TaxID=400682 RepID=A0A1X7VQT8_AMPQE|nr:PREDICTED: exosome complex component CSL4-like [Amphimedon queenslandica]|eukprot:XP_011409363.1 PREDICTED: exosome complex component CSL4-like [Amphimedon queenslandica]
MAVTSKDTPLTSTPFVLPGDKLPPNSDSANNRTGVYVRDGGTYSSICGKVTDSKSTVKPLVPPFMCPEKGNIVLCRVLSVSQISAKVEIISVGSQVLKEPLMGIIRREEVRASEKDKVSLFQSFRPCDIVQARVLGLGEGQAYVLTTAESELGVILARKLCHGGRMIPVSWCEYQCSVTGKREKRKVAKVINNISSN